jgi:hypothetical protein
MLLNTLSFVEVIFSFSAEEWFTTIQTLYLR